VLEGSGEPGGTAVCIEIIIDYKHEHALNATLMNEWLPLQLPLPAHSRIQNCPRAKRVLPDPLAWVHFSKTGEQLVVNEHQKGKKPLKWD
jgi:hypothetical protein